MQYAAPSTHTHPRTAGAPLARRRRASGAPAARFVSLN